MDSWFIHDVFNAKETFVGFSATDYEKLIVVT